MVLFSLQQPLVEQLIRILVIYFFTLAVLRLAGKRRIASLSAFDILIIISLGSAVGDVMLYPESIVSLWGGIIVVLVVLALQVFISKVTEHSDSMRWLIEGSPKDVIVNGKIIYQALEDEDLAEDELYEMLREKGVGKVSEVKRGVLERSGELGLILYDQNLSQKQRVRKKHRLRHHHV